jgi:hypothetical protein
MTKENLYPNDDPNTAARKIAEDLKHHVVPENGKGKSKVHFVQKHSEPGLLAEAVIVGGVPYFAVSKSDSNKITLEPLLKIDDKSEYGPFESSTYLSEAYRFESKRDFEACVQKARDETRDSLYRRVKTIWSKYIDADPFHISICAADTIFLYYQDRMGLTHYLFFIGGNNCGKSNNLLVLKYLAYRNFTSTDMTAPNLYQFLGSGEEGQGTLCEDEADRIDEDRQKMAIHKNGYIKGFPVARTDTSFGRKQMKYNTFCFKAFAAERFPDPVKAKGFNQRVIELQCSSGQPQHDIAEVTDETGAEEFQVLSDELNEMRNTLLLVRLLRFHQVIPDIELNIKGREKQLFKPVLRLFQKTETLVELLPVISNYVVQKREANSSSLHAFLYRVIKDLIKERQTSQLTSSFIWDYIKSNLQGEDIHGKPLSYETSEFGTLSQKEITQMLEHIFGAKIKKTQGIKVLQFNVPKLERLGNFYDLPTEIRVVEGEDEIRDRDRDRDDVDDGDDIGIGRYLAARSNEHGLISDPKLIEHESTLDNSTTDSQDAPQGPDHPPIDCQHLSQTTQATSKINWDKVKEATDWTRKELQELESDPAAKVREYERLSKLSRSRSKEATQVRADKND